MVNCISDLKSVQVGVPQGSTLGPIMFIMYINDLPGNLNHSKALMYADDTVLYCSNSSSKVVRKKMQSDLNNVERWFQENRLSLNVSKTKIMTFMSDHKRKSRFEFKFFMKGNLIEEVDKYKYLGVLLDNRLSGDAQYAKTMQTLGWKIKTFGKIRKFLDTNAALTVYKSTILPIIDYCDQFQLLWNAEKLSKLQKLQNWGLRVVFNSSPVKLDEAALHEEAKLTLLKHRRTLHLLINMFHRSKLVSYLDRRDIATRQFDKI